MLTVYKASAGSGKTFRLVVEFLKLLMKDEQNYRHILAVTFTNKATAEMKERVIEQLSRLSRGENTAYMKLLLIETGHSAEEIKRKAGAALEYILFDYNRFSISTIDKFTQRVIKAFNREVGITADFQIELDNELIINEAVDRLISTIDTNRPLQAWLEDFIEDKIRNNKNFAIEKDLKKLGQELFNEKLQSRMAELQQFFDDPAGRKNYLDMLNQQIHVFQNTVSKQAHVLVDCYTSRGYSTADFSGKSRSIAALLEKIAGNNIPDELPAMAVQASESDDKWVTRTHPDRNSLLSLVSHELKPALKNLISYFNTHSSNYQTAKSIKNEWYTLAVLLDLNREAELLNREKSKLPIANSNVLLKSIIDGNDTPFIYEKTGIQYHHFMLDEFQDTSVMQWDNFKPLISNALSTGSFNLAVGDVKQSIYRWRNSDWSILAGKVFTDFENSLSTTVTLDTNYRSDEKIISFNNLFFNTFVRKIAATEKLAACAALYQPVFDSIYGDLTQKSAGKEVDSGLIRMELIEETDIPFRRNSLDRLTEQIKYLQDNGIEAGDTAILVRTNLQGEEVVNYFLEQAGKIENQSYNLKVLSSESLFLRSSPAVQFVVHVIRFLTDREERLTKATLLHLYSILKRYSARTKYKDTTELEKNPWYLNPDFESEFDQTLLPVITQIEKEILTSSLEEIVIKICAAFRLFDSAVAIPFLQALTDKTAEIRKNMTNDLSYFLKWWEEQGQKVSVQVNDKTNAIRLLTIHKSKGLEYKAVLIPFFDWQLVESKSTILWCSPDKSPFNKAPLVPVAFRESLSKTIFSAEYYHEMFNQLVDNINLAYVAFTRARSVLIVHAPQKCNSNTVAHYFTEALQEIAGKGDFDRHWVADAPGFESGSLHISATKKTPGEDIAVNGWVYNAFDSRLKLRTDSEGFIEITEKGTTRKNLGKIIHGILSEIKTANDAGPAMQKARLQGGPDAATILSVQQIISNMLNHDRAKEWFDGTFTIYNEKNILAPDQINRPDRIMVRGDEAVIIDFKSGSVKNSSYRQQIRRYGQQLRDSGFLKVTGFLWYIQQNEIEAVSLD